MVNTATEYLYILGGKNTCRDVFKMVLLDSIFNSTNAPFLTPSGNLQRHMTAEAYQDVYKFIHL